MTRRRAPSKATVTAPPGMTRTSTHRAEQPTARPTAGGPVIVYLQRFRKPLAVRPWSSSEIMAPAAVPPGQESHTAPEYRSIGRSEGARSNGRSVAHPAPDWPLSTPEPPRDSLSTLSILVGAPGFEPPTSCSQRSVVYAESDRGESSTIGDRGGRKPVSTRVIALSVDANAR